MLSCAPINFPIAHRNDFDGARLDIHVHTFVPCGSENGNDGADHDNSSCLSKSPKIYPWVFL